MKLKQVLLLSVECQELYFRLEIFFMCWSPLFTRQKVFFIRACSAKHVRSALHHAHKNERFLTSQ